MNQRHLTYPLGPYEKDHHAQKLQEMNNALFFLPDSASTIQKELHQDIQTTHHDTQFNLEKLKNDLAVLLQQEQHYLHDIEQTQTGMNAKKTLINNFEQQVQQHLQSLNMLSIYGNNINNQLHQVQHQIHQIKNQIHETECYKKNSSNTLYKHSDVNQDQQTRCPADCLPSNYEPVITTLETLIQFHHISLEYIEKKLIEFRIHFQETQEKRVGWDRIFYRWVVNAWQYEGNNQPFPSDFTPTEESLSELTNQGISLDFCIQALEYFIVFWKEKDVMMGLKIWQSQYKKWVLRAWRRHNQDETRIQASRPTTEEFMDTSWVDRYQFNFHEDSNDSSENNP
ncbi:MAG: hypothetical protein HAW62_04390 [Endozoicomonadaceae bacterium]|nr:hypothetical protein [Endozoicomonadaceae bacterium]